MDWLSTVFRKIGMLIRSRQAPRNFEEKMRLRLDRAAQEQTSSGSGVDDAKEAARRPFGSRLPLRERSWEVWG